MRKAASMKLRDLAYRLYERRLEASLSPDVIPRHVGVMCDGNRRWARSAGFRDVSNGHRKGADKIFELLDWCRETGVEVVTLWLLSTEVPIVMIRVTPASAARRSTSSRSFAKSG